MFGPRLSQLGFIITALVHMKKKIRSHTVFIRLSTKSTLDEVGSPSAANGRSPNAAQCNGNNWADNFQWGSGRDKTCFTCPIYSPGVIVSSFSLSLSLSLWKFVISVRSRQIRAGKHTKSLCEEVVQNTRRLWSDCADAHADLNLRGTYMCHIGFIVL